MKYRMCTFSGDNQTKLEISLSTNHVEKSLNSSICFFIFYVLCECLCG